VHPSAGVPGAKYGDILVSTFGERRTDIIQEPLKSGRSGAKTTWLRQSDRSAAWQACASFTGGPRGYPTPLAPHRLLLFAPVENADGA
jgi:hypothetical protein